MRGVKKSHLPEKNRTVCERHGFAATPAWGITHCVRFTHAKVSLNSRPIGRHGWAFHWTELESCGPRRRRRSASGRSVGGSALRASESESAVTL